MTDATATEVPKVKETKEPTETRNHTHGAKTIPIECKGYEDENGKMVFAENHTELRLVFPQDVHQCTRCEACQEAYSRIRQKQSAGKRRSKDRLKKLEARAVQAEQTKTQFGDRLQKEQIAELDKTIKEFKDHKVEMVKA